LDLNARGGPIDQVLLDPYFAPANKIMIARHAPHPHAAALFMDWALSEQGQSIITTFTCRGAKGRQTKVSGEKEMFIVDLDFITPIMDQTGKSSARSFSAVSLG
jgi:iron(III) transport system substrate-binding protein